MKVPPWVGFVVPSLVFQGQWLLCVMSGMGVWPYAYGLAFLLLAIQIQADGQRRPALVLSLASIGIVHDALLGFAHILYYGQRPLWLPVLWLCFAHWFVRANWLSKRYVFSSLVFALGGALSYTTASHWGALTLMPPLLPHALLIGLDWGMLGLLFVYISAFSASITRI